MHGSESQGENNTFSITKRAPQLQTSGKFGTHRMRFLFLPASRSSPLFSLALAFFKLAGSTQYREVLHQ